MRCCVDERFPVARTRAAAIEFAMVTLLRRRRALVPVGSVFTAVAAFVFLCAAGSRFAPTSRLAQLLPLALLLGVLAATGLALTLLSMLAWRIRLARLWRGDRREAETAFDAPTSVDGSPAGGEAVFPASLATRRT
jgi:hypothetical protein